MLLSVDIIKQSHYAFAHIVGDIYEVKKSKGMFNVGEYVDSKNIIGLMNTNLQVALIFEGGRLIHQNFVLK